MPTFDCRLNSANPQSVPPGALPFPRLSGKAGKLVDANGVLIPWVIRANTETGVVEQYERVNGKFVVDPASLRLVVVRSLHPAPLQYIFADEPVPDAIIRANV